ncbi:MAG: hypothetical protein QME41_03855 [Actinomycetota bacterium]|nr:hypothetical protein [Actinomycetota bacterium]
MKDNLAKLYPGLTPDERFRLVLDAMARDDDKELLQLKDTCPRKDYTMLDAEFLDKLKATEIIVLILASFLEFALSEVEKAKASFTNYFQLMESWMRGYVRGSNNAWAKAGKKDVLLDIDGREPTNEEIREIALSACIEDIPEIVDQLLIESVVQLKSVYQGFEKFWGEAIKIKPEKFLSLYNPVLANVVESAKDCINSKISADEAVVEDVYRVFCNRWPGIENKAD